MKAIRIRLVQLFVIVAVIAQPFVSVTPRASADDAATSLSARPAVPVAPNGPLTVQSTLYHGHHDTTNDNGADDDVYWVKYRGQLLALDVQGNADGLEALENQLVQVRGVVDGNHLTVNADAVLPLAGATANAITAASVVTGNKTMAVVLVHLTDSPLSPYASSDIASQYFGATDSVSSSYKLASNNQLSLSGQTFGWISVPYASAGCDDTDWQNSADQALVTAGTNLSTFDYVSYVFNTVPGSCDSAGVGMMPGSENWIYGVDSSLRSVVAHEWGHNLGVNHANSLQCVDLDGIVSNYSANCTSNEYGDGASVMGYSRAGVLPLMDGIHSNYLGWLAPARVATISSATTVTLNRLYTNAGTTMVKVVRPNGKFLWIEFRAPNGDYDTQITTGVVAYHDDITPDLHSNLIAAGLNVGDAFYDYQSGAVIKITALSATSATLAITYGITAGTPGSVSNVASAPAEAGASALVSWAPPSDTSNISFYKVWRDGVAVTSSSIRSGNSAVVHNAMTPGQTYTFQVAEVDIFGRTGPRSAPVTMVAPTPDSQKPTKPTNLIQTFSSASALTLAWSPSTDNIAVTHYRVVALSAYGWETVTNDVTTASTTFNVGAHDSQTLGSNSTYIVRVTALDAMGNESDDAELWVNVPDDPTGTTTSTTTSPPTSTTPTTTLPTLDQPQPAPVAVGQPVSTGAWMVAADGGVFSFGRAQFYGSTGGLKLNSPVVGMAATPTGKGYWFVAADGGIFAYGDAQFYGSMGGKALNQPVVGMAATPSGHGYWLVARDGGIFSFGDARFFGSTGSIKLNKPIVGMTASPDGKGYWFVASDGGIFAYGDATFYGSKGGAALSAPVVSMASTPDGLGYSLLLSDGHVFGFGSARNDGDAPVGSAAIASGASGGYAVAGANGGLTTYGALTATLGSTGALHLNQPIVGMTIVDQ